MTVKMNQQGRRMLDTTKKVGELDSDETQYKEMLKQVGATIKMYRKSKHLLQTDLAKKLQVSPSTITNIERGTVGITSKMMFLLAREFNIHLAQLFLTDDFICLSKKQLLGLAFSEKVK